MTPEERVRMFLDAMLAWERRVFPTCTTDTREQMQAHTAGLLAIFREHLTEKGRGPKEWGKKIHPTRGIPTSFSDGQYDQEIDRVETTGRKTTFYVFTSWRPNPTMVYRYKVVVDGAGESRVDEMRSGSVFGGKSPDKWRSYTY